MSFSLGNLKVVLAISGSMFLLIQARTSARNNAFSGLSGLNIRFPFVKLLGLTLEKLMQVGYLQPT